MFCGNSLENLINDSQENPTERRSQAENSQQFLGFVDFSLNANKEKEEEIRKPKKREEVSCFFLNIQEVQNLRKKMEEVGENQEKKKCQVFLQIFKKIQILRRKLGKDKKIHEKKFQVFLQIFKKKCKF